jgi:hypothetical protein
VDIATCLVVAACVPMFWHTMTEARPDLPWGLALGLAIGSVLYRPFLQRSRWSLFGLGALCGLAAAIKPSAFPASLTCIGLAAGAQLVCECLEADGGGFRAAVRRAGLPALIFAAGLLAATFAIIGFELVNTSTTFALRWSTTGISGAPTRASAPACCTTRSAPRAASR